MFAIIGIIAVGLVVPIWGSNKSTYHFSWTMADSSEPPKWDKISNDDYFSANLYRFTKPDNFIELELKDHDYDTFEFYYNTFENNPVKDAPQASIDTKISVVFGKKAGDLIEIFSKQVVKVEKKKLKINLSDWSEKTVILKINVKSNPTTGIELFALHFYKKKIKPKRVMLISLDTVGADHLGLYGYKNFATSPGL